MSQEQKNPSEYNYTGDELITITAREFASLNGVVDYALDQETNKFYPEKYNFINKETNERVNKVTEKNKHLAIKVVDLERTLDGDPIISRTRRGQDILRVKLILEKIHMQNVDSGIAKHYTELQELRGNQVKSSSEEQFSNQAEDFPFEDVPTEPVSEN